MTYTGIINPLDWETILIGYFAGGIEIFIWVAFVFIGYFAAKWRFNSAGLFAMLLLFAMIMQPFHMAITAMAVMILGLIGAIILGRSFNQ